MKVFEYLFGSQKLSGVSFLNHRSDESISFLTGLIFFAGGGGGGVVLDSNLK